MAEIVWGKDHRRNWFDQEEANKRLLALDGFFEAFKAGSDSEIKYIEDASKIVNNIYWRFISEQIKVYLEGKENSKTSAYKIASCTELSIMLVLPIEHDTMEERLKLNSSLAFYVALSILQEWHEIPIGKVQQSISKISELSKFASEHLRWLALLDPKFDFPVFSNSQTWRLFEYIILNQK